MPDNINRVDVTAVIDKPPTPFTYTPEMLGSPPLPFTGKGVKICLVDSGIPDHEAIKNLADQVNFADTKDCRDYIGHSTVVSGLIFGNKENEFMGIAPDAIALYAKVIDDEAKTRLDSIIAAILWGVIKDCDIICIPLCSPVDSPSVHDAIRKATENGVLVISSAGSPGEAAYPAAYPEVLSVGATNGHNVLAEFSSKGDVNVIGVNMISTYVSQDYAIVSGSSVACGLATGIAARFIEARRTTGSPVSPNILSSVMKSALPSL